MKLFVDLSKYISRGSPSAYGDGQFPFVDNGLFTNRWSQWDYLCGEATCLLSKLTQKQWQQHRTILGKSLSLTYTPREVSLGFTDVCSDRNRLGGGGFHVSGGLESAQPLCAVRVPRVGANRIRMRGYDSCVP